MFQNQFPLNNYNINSGYNQYLNSQTNNLIRVTGIEGAKAYQMNPNSSVALFDNNNDIFYVKTTDGAGFPTIRAFKFESIENNTEKTEFITREEFENLKSEVESYGKQFVQRQSETTKSK